MKYTEEERRQVEGIALELVLRGPYFFKHKPENFQEIAQEVNRTIEGQIEADRILDLQRRSDPNWPPRMVPCVPPKYIPPADLLRRSE